MISVDDTFKDESGRVFVTEGHIVIDAGFEYNIAINRCDTSEKLLHWIWHLTEKTWMRNELMRKFIQVACDASGIERHNA